ncbi:glycosyltransferase family 2 protein [Xanthomonas arboricola pv. corylina]|uniref:glycosyltransferase family 2 protein n=1 Tax=Xanthomonas arboricola TaxID=56448 RepID=UPI0005846B1B|nr:glycosyltransferase family 2 protein [Xanthomonas arboricola]UQQ15245.1 glycosyltransferase family 2 protein [Xanthomonas arboricola pv. corylina]
MQPDISVVIPVYGSATILPTLAEKLEESLTALTDRFEVVLVYDCSPDSSWQVITGLCASRSWLKGVRLRKNAGQHNALMAGFGVARGRYIVTMDDDLQHSPSDIGRVVAELRSGADVCYVQFKSRRHALWKRLGSQFNDRMASWLLAKPRGLYLSPFRGLISEVRDEILRYGGPFVYVDGLIVQSTSNITTIEAEHHARSDGKSGYSLRKSISLWMQMATSFSITPLRVASLTGIVSSGLGFLCAIVLIVQKLLWPHTVIGWTSLIVAVLIMGGIQLLALGVVGEYVGRVLLNVSNRPQYIKGQQLNVGQEQENVQ